MSRIEEQTGDLLRSLAPQVFGALVRRYGHFDLAEDAVQEALAAATVQWRDQGVSDDPKAWLITVSSRRLTDLLRSEQARRRREHVVASWELAEREGTDRPEEADDTLILLFMCCHPSLSPASQIALTLRAVGGLTTTEVARAFLVPEATMTRRITRAKQSIKESGVPFGLPPESERPDRLASVLHVLYLIFNEGYSATSGPDLHRSALSNEAIRLTRMVRDLVPDDPEITGLLALMLLTDARRPARIDEDGVAVPMASQDRSLWDQELITEGTVLVGAALERRRPGPYQIQAAIAALHDEAVSAEETDWSQILALYEKLLEMSGNPVVALNHAVAVAMVQGPERGLELVEGVAADPRLAGSHRVAAARAHMLEMAGDLEAAREGYLGAAAMAMSIPAQRYLYAQARRLED